MAEPFVVDRYLVCDEIGSGGMAKVHLGRVLGAGGFSRVVAIKRVIGESADDDLATMLIDEARLASRIRHPNVVTALDVVRSEGHLLFVMEYVHGPSLAWLVRRHHSEGTRIPQAIAVRIVVDVLAGLHAAHEARSERGRALDLIHRDVSPQNVLVGEDGVARVADFGIAHAKGKLNQTEAGVIRGKLLYMAPEQLRGETLDRRADVYAVGIVLWEILTGKRLRSGASAGTPITKIIEDYAGTPVDPPSRHAECPPALEAVVMKALARTPAERWATALEMADALERACAVASTKEVAVWMRSVAGAMLDARAKIVGDIEAVSAAYELSSAPTTPRGATPALVARPADAAGTLQYAPTVVQVAPPMMAGAEPMKELPSTRKSARRRGSVALAGAIIALLGVTAGVGGVVIVRSMAKNASDASTTPSSATSGSAAVSAATAASTSLAPSAPPASASASATTSARPSATTRAKTKPPLARRDCDPPYVVDEQGVRVPKRECFPEK